jgi:hypothetical protein
VVAEVEKLMAAGYNGWNWVFTNNRLRIFKIKLTMRQKLKMLAYKRLK